MCGCDVGCTGVHGDVDSLSKTKKGNNCVLYCNVKDSCPRMYTKHCVEIIEIRTANCEHRQKKRLWQMHLKELNIIFVSLKLCLGPDKFFRWDPSGSKDLRGDTHASKKRTMNRSNTHVLIVGVFWRLGKLWQQIPYCSRMTLRDLGACCRQI